MVEHARRGARAITGTDSPEVAVIPVGGRGSRFGTPHGARYHSKLFFQICDLEILAYPILSLRHCGCRTILLVTSDVTHGEVASYIGEFQSLFFPVTFQILNANARGTARALLAAMPFIEGAFYYTNGDIIFAPSLLDDLARTHDPRSSIATLAGSPLDLAPTHPHFICASMGALGAVEIYPSASPNSYCSMETCLFEPTIFRYLERLSSTAMTMEALTPALQEANGAFVLRYMDFWFHLAEPSDIVKADQHSTQIREIRKILQGNVA